MSQLSKNSLMLRACYLYYFQGKNIQEIAEILEISRFRVSRYITEANERGLISFEINDPQIDYEALSIKLEQKFNLKRVITVPVIEGARSDDVRHLIGSAGRYFFNDLEKDIDIAMTWGRTMAYMVQAIPEGISHVKHVVELAGSFGTISDFFTAHKVSLIAADKFGSPCVQLPAPVLVGSEHTAEVLLHEPNIQQALDMAANCDMVICGVGPILSLDSSLLIAGFLKEEDMEYLKSKGAIGSIMGRFFDAQGQECDTVFKNTVICLSMEKYLKIPERVIFAGGNHKEDAIYALINNQTVNCLITDSQTAEALLKKKEQEEK
jgi:deoxyribonucleoside regulator